MFTLTKAVPAKLQKSFSTSNFKLASVESSAGSPVVGPVLLEAPLARRRPPQQRAAMPGRARTPLPSRRRQSLTG